VNSIRGTRFRIWATSILRDHILKGFTINQKRLKENSELKLKELEATVKLFKTVIDKKQLGQSEADGLLRVITDYANAWVLLQKYDEGKLKISAGSKKGEVFGFDTVVAMIEQLKTNLMKKREASELFGAQRGHALHSIVGSIGQSFGGRDLYGSIEEKAANILYLVIKDHPFSDGNKRIGSFLFIAFLAKNHYLNNKKGEKKINDNTLVALALLVAESKPTDKEIMIKLITNLLNQ
jgi:prophage maintenance system killer protein